MIDDRLFINRLYDEGFSLLVEARNYFQFSEAARDSSRAENPRDRLFVNYQAMRLTSRMTQTMAWLLAQRAAHAGELTTVEACGGDFSLGGENFCVEADGHDDFRVPSGMRKLLDRSHMLYHRVWRLDQSAREKVAK
jgi:regulator of CtrA degradation